MRFTKEKFMFSFPFFVRHFRQRLSALAELAKPEQLSKLTWCIQSFSLEKFFKVIKTVKGWLSEPEQGTGYCSCINMRKIFVEVINPIKQHNYLACFSTRTALELASVAEP